MALVKRAAQHLLDTEKALRALLADGASNGSDYDDLFRVAELAKAVRRMADGATSHRPPATTRNAAAATRKVGKVGTATKRRRNPATGRSRANTRKYPVFLRTGDNLIKVAWSKSSKAEYEHKAPKRALTDLVAVIAEVGARQDQFTTEDVMPVKDSRDKTEIPSYQAYLCLAWLREAALVQRHGRQGYSVTDPEGLRGQVDTHWQMLPVKTLNK